MLSNKDKFRDRNPGVIPAGKLFNGGDTARQCLKNPLRPNTPEEILKFRGSTQPAPGKTRIFYGRHGDPDIASHLTHGINTKPSYVAGQLVNPKPLSYFKFRLNEKREEATYASRQRAPLGYSHDQRKGLPDGMDPGSQKFGLPVIKDCSAGELVNPAKSYKQVLVESKQGLDLYKKSHSAYIVGESYDRKYDWQRIPKTSSFGIDTPHDNRGLNTKKTLKWLQETRSEKAAHVTSKQVDDFRERHVSQVGTVHDPIKETMHVPDDHVYGIIVQPDQYGAGDLIHMRKHQQFLRGKDRERGFLAAIRQHLKKANYHNFVDLKSAFQFYDKDQSGKIDIEELRAVCQELKLPVNIAVLESLLELCDPNADKQIDYVEFVNFLNWKDQMATGFGNDPEYEDRILAAAKHSGVNLDDKGDITADVLKNQIDLYSNFITSYSTYGDGKPDGDCPQYGIPTIRSDLPAPRIRRIGDNTNYGDESDAHGLMNPSVYSNNGVFEEDFFKSREPHEIRRICDSIGVEMTDEMFQDIWDKAKEITMNGEVSVESFRHVLDEQVANKFQKLTMQEHANNFQDNLKTMTMTKPAIYQKLHPVLPPIMST